MGDLSTFWCLLQFLSSKIQCSCHTSLPLVWLELLWDILCYFWQFLLCATIWGVLVLVLLWKFCRILSWNHLVLCIFFLVGRRLMTVSISSAVIGLFNLLSGLDLILVNDIYPENCPFTLSFPILWSAGFQSMTWRFSGFLPCLLLWPPFIWCW